MSNDSSKARKYRLKVRAQRQQETRRRIAAAVAGLHEEVGPARTTIAEVARRAGVQRPTVYNNFPDERGLFAACQQHFLTEHPPPDPSAALALDDPAERVQAVLGGLYGWYRETEPMSEKVQRDRRLLPALDALLTDTSDQRLMGLADELAQGFGRRGRANRQTRAMVRLGLDFLTWQRLTRDGLSDGAAAALMAEAARAAAAAPASVRSPHVGEGTDQLRGSRRPR